MHHKCRYRYLFYGISFESDIYLSGFLPAGNAIRDQGERIVVRRRDFPALSPMARCYRFRRNLAYWSDLEGRFGLILLANGEKARIQFTTKAIDWQPPPKAPTASPHLAVVENALAALLPYFGPYLPLHASSLVSSGKGCLFLAPSKGGKSTLAASFLNQNFSFLGDDLAVLQRVEDQFIIQPGFPYLKLGRKAGRLNGHAVKSIPPCSRHKGSKRIFFLEKGAGWKARQKHETLKKLYLLSRSPGAKLEIQRLNTKEALIEIVRNFYNDIPQKPKILKQQFDLANQLIQKIPVARLRYPSGFRFLPKIRQAVVQDLQAES